MDAGRHGSLIGGSPAGLEAISNTAAATASSARFGEAAWHYRHARRRRACAHAAHVLPEVPVRAWAALGRLPTTDTSLIYLCAGGMTVALPFTTTHEENRITRLT